MRAPCGHMGDTPSTSLGVPRLCGTVSRSRRTHMELPTKLPKVLLYKQCWPAHDAEEPEQCVLGNSILAPAPAALGGRGGPPTDGMSWREQEATPFVHHMQTQMLPYNFSHGTCIPVQFQGSGVNGAAQLQLPQEHPCSMWLHPLCRSGTGRRGDLSSCTCTTARLAPLPIHDARTI